MTKNTVKRLKYLVYRHKAVRSNFLLRWNIKFIFKQYIIPINTPAVFLIVQNYEFTLFVYMFMQLVQNSFC